LGIERSTKNPDPEEDTLQEYKLDGGNIAVSQHEKKKIRETELHNHKGGDRQKTVNQNRVEKPTV